METVKNIYTKLFEVKKAWIKLQRDTKAFNYKYATLSQIQEKYSDILEKLNLVVVHSIWNNCVMTEIVDLECTEHNYRRVYSTIEMNKDTKPQDKWSEITYFRRYNLLSLLDLEVEDDDGKKAQDSKPKEEKVWYNDTPKHIDKWEDMVAEWKTTWKEILARVTANWVCINWKDKETILNLDK
jgi:hypothetical protein